MPAVDPNLLGRDLAKDMTRQAIEVFLRKADIASLIMPGDQIMTAQLVASANIRAYLLTAALAGRKDHVSEREVIDVFHRMEQNLFDHALVLAVQLATEQREKRVAV